MAQARATTRPLNQLLATIQRAIGGRPVRTAQIRLAPLGGIDPKETTGYDSKAAAKQRAKDLAESFQDPWKQARIARYKDYREIMEETPELAEALRVYVGLIFGGGEDGNNFEIEFATNARPEIQRIVEMTIADLDLQSSVKKTAFEGLWLGDSPSELVFGDSPMRIVGERPIQPEKFRVMVGEYEHVSHYEVLDQDGTEPRLLHPFLVVHYAPRSPKGSKYGWSLFHSARRIRRNHDVFSDVMAMLGLRKASGDVVYLFPMPDGLDKATQDEWVQQVQDSNDTENYFDRDGQLRRKAAASLDTVPKIVPYRVQTNPDGSVAYDAKPTVVETKAADFAQMVKVLEHLQDRFFVAAGVPAALVGMNRNENARATLEVQGVHLGIAVRADQRDLAVLVDEILTRACLVQGFVPEPGEWLVVMPKTGAFDELLQADVFQKRAAGVASLVQAGTPLRQALKEGFDYDDEALDEIQDAIDQSGADQEVVMAAIETAAKKGLRVVIEGGGQR